MAVGTDDNPALFNGDPFKYAAQCVGARIKGTDIEGTVVADGQRARER